MLAWQVSLVLLRMGSNPNELHPQVVDVGTFITNYMPLVLFIVLFEGFAAVVVDGAGTFIDFEIMGAQDTVWETETIFDCFFRMEQYSIQASRISWSMRDCKAKEMQ